MACARPLGFEVRAFEAGWRAGVAYAEDQRRNVAARMLKEINEPRRRTPRNRQAERQAP
jgi:hypothetical protein